MAGCSLNGCQDHFETTGLNESSSSGLLLSLMVRCGIRQSYLRIRIINLNFSRKEFVSQRNEVLVDPRVEPDLSLMNVKSVAIEPDRSHARQPEARESTNEDERCPGCVLLNACQAMTCVRVAGSSRHKLLNFATTLHSSLWNPLRRSSLRILLLTSSVKVAILLSHRVFAWRPDNVRISLVFAPITFAYASADRLSVQ